MSAWKIVILKGRVHNLLYMDFYITLSLSIILEMIGKPVDIYIFSYYFILPWNCQSLEAGFWRIISWCTPTENEDKHASVCALKILLIVTSYEILIGFTKNQN